MKEEDTADEDMAAVLGLLGVAAEACAGGYGASYYGGRGAGSYGDCVGGGNAGGYGELSDAGGTGGGGYYGGGAGGGYMPRGYYRPPPSAFRFGE